MAPLPCSFSFASSSDVWNNRAAFSETLLLMPWAHRLVRQQTSSSEGAVVPDDTPAGPSVDVGFIEKPHEARRSGSVEVLIRLEGRQLERQATVSRLRGCDDGW